MMIEKKTALATGSPSTPSAQTKQAVKTNQRLVQNEDTTSFFHKENYTWMLAGLIVIAIGMLVMSGGKSNNPAVFDQKEVYSTTRITIAPILIVIGLGLEVFAIFKKPKTDKL